MTDNTQPEAMSLADWLEAVGGGPSAKRCAALLREQHTRIAELESELEAVGAGGVQALSAAPEAIAKLRHLYQNMVNGAVRDTASAKRIAEGLLAPAIEALERATPPAEQQAAPKAAPPSDDAVKDAARYRWLIDQHWIQTEVEWRLISTHQDSTIRQLDAAIDAALAAQGGKV